METLFDRGGCAGKIAFQVFVEEGRVLCNVLEGPASDVSASTAVVSISWASLLGNAIDGRLIVETKVASVEDVVSLGVAREVVELTEVAWASYQSLFVYTCGRERLYL